MDDVRFIVIDDEKDQLLQDAEEVGLREGDARALDPLGLDPLTTALLIGGGLAAARFIVGVWDKYRGGVRIDLGTRPPTVERVRGVPYGAFIIFAADDEVRVETRDEPEEVIERIVKRIFSLGHDAKAADVTKVIDDARKGEAVQG